MAAADRWRPGMSGARYVPTKAAKDAIRGREAEIVRALGIPWNVGGKHIRCPDPAHPDKHPSWRLQDDGCAVCTCRKPHSVFDVIGYAKGLDFEASKIMAVELIGRSDLIVEPAAGLMLAEYTEAKRLPIDWLRSLGVRDAKYGQTPAVMFPFHNAAGQLSGIHYRL